MSQYTSGEMAKLCGVSVRTVQYYDTRGILVPSALSEGGRRLYSEEDLKRLKVICFLRSIDLPINSIAKLLSEEHPENVISLLLDQQSREMRSEIRERQEKLQTLEVLRRELRGMEHLSIEFMHDIAYRMENKKKLHRVYAVMLAMAIPLEIIETGLLVYAITKGQWLPWLLGMPVILLMGVWISRYYFKHVAYICPECHEVFRPQFREAFFANHTPRTRKLRCPACGHKGFCVETYGEAGEEK